MSYRTFKNGSPDINRIAQRKFLSPNDQKYNGNEPKSPKLYEYGSLAKEKLNSKQNLQLNNKNNNEKPKVTPQHNPKPSQQQQKTQTDRVKIYKDGIDKKQSVEQPNDRKDSTLKFQRRPERKMLLSELADKKTAEKKQQQHEPQPPHQQKLQEQTLEVLAESGELSHRVLLPSKLRNKPIEVTVINHENRNSFRMKQSSSSFIENIKIADAISKSQDTTKVDQPQPFFSQQNSNHNPNPKSKTNRQEAALLHRKLQHDKLDLQQKNTQLIQSQFQLQNEIQLLKIRNTQLQKQTQTSHEIANASTHQTSRLITNNQKLMKAMEERHASITDNYREQTRRNHELNEIIKQIAAERDQLENRVRQLEHECRSRDQQLGRSAKMTEVRMQEIKQTSDYRLQEMQIRFNEQNQQIILCQRREKQLQNQLLLKDQERSLQQQQSHALQRQNQKIDQLESLLQSKAKENAILLDELNSTREDSLNIINSHSRRIQLLETDARQKQKVIQQTQQQLQSLHTNHDQHNLAHQTKSQMYRAQGNTEQLQGERSFEELVKTQTEQTNRLRSLLFDKTEEVYRIQCENQELREKVRRLEQQLQILVKTNTSNLKNIKQAKEGNETMLKAEIQSLRRKTQHLEDRLHDAQGQINSKNKFIQTHLLTHSKKEDAPQLLLKLQSLLPST